MADAPTLSPEVSRGVSALARTLVAAARSWALYPPDHPAVRGSLERLRTSIADTSGGQMFAFGVTPDTLLVAGIAVGGRDAGTIAEAARWLHDRDILELTFACDVAVPALQRLLGVLSEDSRVIRRRGGPAKVWSEEGDAAIAIQQIDFSHLMEEREVTNPVRRKDDLWRSIVRGVLDRRRPTDEATQARLLEISSDVMAIGELAGDVIAPHHAIDGSPMLTSQAAAVVAAYHHLVSIVDVLSPERKQEVMQNLAAATSNLNPHVVMQMLSGPEAAEAGGAAGEATGAVVSGIVNAMDDTRVAQLLATTLAIEGQASERLATVFNTIATDDNRKQRVLTMTRHMLAETDFGRQDAFQNLWSSMEELLLTYNERPFVSASYRAGLDQIGGRAEQMASDVPQELVEMLDTLGQDNVRRLSVRLLIDLLKLERDAARAPELAQDVAALADDLFLAGDYESVLAVVTALQEQAADSAAVASGASRVAMDGIVNTVPFVETAEILGEMADAEAAAFAEICARIGPATTDALKVHLDSETLTPARARTTAIVKKFGARAVSRLSSVAASSKWAARRNLAELLGDLGVAEAVPLLQPLLRGQDARVTTAAVRALANIKDPAAARAVHTVLRAATGDQRRAVVEALVAQRDVRVVPVLVRIVEESDPFGADHAIVLETVGALSQVGDDQAVPALSALMRKKKFLAWKKARALKEQSLAALRAIKTPAAAQAVADAAKTGDRMLRKLAASGGASHG
jgi:HEAT repeat protein